MNLSNILDEPIIRYSYTRALFNLSFCFYSYFISANTDGGADGYFYGADSNSLILKIISSFFLFICSIYDLLLAS
jgi:hypothetical protein